MKFTEPALAAPLLPPTLESTDANILAAMKKLRYPVLASLKLDGIRALRLNGTLLSRRLKKIPNKVIRERSLVLPGGMDMELFARNLEFCQVTSIVMSKEHEFSDMINFHLLDAFPTDYSVSYAQRCDTIAQYMGALAPEHHEHVKFAPPSMMHNAEQLFTFFLTCEQELGEGICFRLPNSPYKCGRSTLKEQYLIKLCRYTISEAIITGFVEQLANCNGERRNLTGHMDRRSHSLNMIGKGTLGAFICKDIHNDIEFAVGTGNGLDDKLRSEVWDNQHKYLAKIISYRCKNHGKKTKPRNPTFRGFRDPIDL